MPRADATDSNRDSRRARSIRTAGTSAPPVWNLAFNMGRLWRWSRSSSTCRAWRWCASRTASRPAAAATAERISASARRRGQSDRPRLRMPGPFAFWDDVARRKRHGGPRRTIHRDPSRRPRPPRASRPAHHHGLKPAAGTAISPALGSRSSPGGASPARDPQRPARIDDSVCATEIHTRVAGRRERLKPGFARNEQRPGLWPF